MTFASSATMPQPRIILHRALFCVDLYSTVRKKVARKIRTRIWREKKVVKKGVHWSSLQSMVGEMGSQEQFEYAGVIIESISGLCLLLVIVQLFV